MGKGIAKSNNLNLIPRTYMIEERTEPDKLPFDSPPLPHTYTHTSTRERHTERETKRETEGDIHVASGTMIFIFNNAYVGID